METQTLIVWKQHCLDYVCVRDFVVVDVVVGKSGGMQKGWTERGEEDPLIFESLFHGRDFQLIVNVVE